MSSTRFTEDHRISLTSVLSRTSGYTPTRRLLTITTRAVALKTPLVAVRKWLHNLLEDNDKMRVLVDQDAAWYAAVDCAREVVGQRASREGLERVLESSVRRMIALSLTPGFSSLSRGGGGAGNEKLVVKEIDARAVCVIVAKRVVQNIAERGIDTAIVSQALLHAQVGVSPIVVRNSLEWGDRNRFIIRKQRSRSGAHTYALRQLRPQQSDALIEKADVVESLLDIVAPDVKATGEEPTYPSADPNDLEGTGIGMEELRLRRASKRISRMNAKSAMGEESSNSFGGIQFGVWEPRGIAAGLNPIFAADVAADVIWSVDSIVWRRVFMGNSLGNLSWEEWGQFLADVMGEPPSSIGVKPTTVKKGRLLRAFPRLIERLNNGERWRDIILEAEMRREPQAILQERMDTWREKSATTKARNESFLTLNAHLEPVIDAVLMRAGAIPAMSADNDTKDGWLGELKRVLEEQPPPPQVVEEVRTRLGRRIARRGYYKTQVAMILDYVLPLDGGAPSVGAHAQAQVEVSDEEVLALII